MSFRQPLPVPRVSKTLEQIRAELFAQVETVQDEYAAKGWLPARLNLNKGVVRGLLELFAWGLWQLYQVLEAVLQQAVPLHASGEWLDVHCDQVGISRKSAMKARGNVLFFRAAGADVDSNIPIPKGRILRTLPDGRGEVYRYLTLTDAVIPAQATSAPVLVESEVYGSGANAGAGQIRELASPVPGVDRVSNGADWLTDEGADTEPDSQQQVRYVYAWLAKAGVTAAAYKSAALSVRGVLEVAVADQHPRGEGTIDIIVRGTAGMPTDNLLRAVTEAIDAQVIINHDRLVKAPVPVAVCVVMELELLVGDEAATRLAAQAFVHSMFGGNTATITGLQPFGIGHDVIRERLAAGIIILPGVKKINWSGTLVDGDLAVPTDGLAVLESVAVTSIWVEEA